MSVNKRIFEWCNLKGNSNCKNWCYSVEKKFEDLRLNGFADNKGVLVRKCNVNAVQEVLARSEESAWLDIIDKEQAVNGRGHNKSRTYIG